MFRGFFTRYRVYYCAHIPGLTNANVFDRPEQFEKPEPKNGVERVIALFHKDERGEFSKEFVSSSQIIVGSGILLAFYGGIKHSKGAFENWITLNSTSRFRTAYQAKRALHDYIALEFAKQFFIYGAKGILFTGILMFVLVSVAAYRDKNGILEFSIAGLVAGSFMRITYGLRGMIAGAVVGTGVSTAIGTILNLLMRLNNYTIKDFRKWQYDLQVARNDAMRKMESDADDNALNISLKRYSSRLTQLNSQNDGEVFVLVNSENKSVGTNDDVPAS